jgi:urease accessory protein
LAFKQGAAGTVVRDFYQSGSLRLRLPRTIAGSPPEAVLLNTGGGLVQGDLLRQRATWEASTTATLVSQAAEKVYRADASDPRGEARVESRLEVGAGASAEWLPQETILFNHARLSRDMQVRLDGSSRFLGVEAVVLGRTAMGETMDDGLLDDRWRIWRDGRLIYADALRLEGPVQSLMRRAAIGGGARATAVLIHVSTQAAALLAPVREALDGALGLAAASAWNDMLVVRLLAPDGAKLRHDLNRALPALRDGRAPPRVWSC